LSVAIASANVQCENPITDIIIIIIACADCVKVNLDFLGSICNAPQVLQSNKYNLGFIINLLTLKDVGRLVITLVLIESKNFCLKLWMNE
jgi:hypothetical protein